MRSASGIAADAVAALVPLIEAKTGITLSPSALLAVGRRVAAELDGGSSKNAAELVAALRAAPLTAPAWRPFLSVVLNGQTCFFRDASQVALLRAVVWRRASRGACTRIWSTSCSTGEEAYSAAIVCADADAPAVVVGTDVRAEAIEHAQRGRYGAWSLRRLADDLRARHFSAAGDELTVRDHLRRTTQFAQYDLLGAPGVPAGAEGGGRFDVILCRHLFIYLGRREIEAICARLAPLLADDGLLVLSPAESLRGLDVPFQIGWCEGQIVYRHQRLPGDGDAAAAPAFADVPAASVADRPHHVVATRPERSPVRAPPPARAAAPMPRSQAEPWADSASWRPVTDWVTHAVAAALRDDVAEVRSIVDAVPEGQRGLDALLIGGHLALRAHEFPAAVASYRKARELAPLSAECHFFEGLAYRRSDKLDEAVRALERALFLAPACWPATYVLAGAYRRCKRLDDARRELWRTLKIVEETPKVFVFATPAVFRSWFIHRADEVAHACRAALAERPQSEDRT